MKKLILSLSIALASVSLADEIIQGVPFTLTATADGTAPFTYQWSRNGVVVPGYTTSIVNVPAATADMAGLYSVLIANKAGSTAASVTLTVKAPVPVVVPPSNAKITIAQKILAWLKSFGANKG